MKLIILIIILLIIKVKMSPRLDIKKDPYGNISFILWYNWKGDRDYIRINIGA